MGKQIEFKESRITTVAGAGGGTWGSITGEISDQAEFTDTPTLNKIPIANGAGGKLAAGWIPDLSDSYLRTVDPSAVSGDFPVLDATGKILSDSGYAPNDFVVSNYDTILGDFQWDCPTKTLTCVGTINAGELVQFYYDVSELKWIISDVSTDTPAFGVAVETKTNAALKVMPFGRYKNSTAFNFTPGAEIYRNRTTDGGLQEGAPATPGDKVQRIGLAEDANTLFLDRGVDVGTVAS